MAEEVPMAQLIKGMYGHEFHNESTLFGIRCGQMRADDFVHNGGWYNKLGERLGFGDLSHDDFRKISEELNKDELFIVLGESDSFWNFVDHNPGLIGSMCGVKPTAEAPGVDYIADKCAYIIGKNQLFFVDRYGTRTEESFWSGNRLEFKVLSRVAVREMLKSS